MKGNLAFQVTYMHNLNREHMRVTGNSAFQVKYMHKFYFVKHMTHL